MKITIWTPIYPTENDVKILKALEKYFPEIDFRVSKREICGETDRKSALNLLRDKIIEKQIKNTVKYLVLQYKTSNGTKLMLNKQAFIAGRINFVEEDYLFGNINIEIETDNLEEFLEYIMGIKN